MQYHSMCWSVMGNKICNSYVCTKIIYTGKSNALACRCLWKEWCFGDAGNYPPLKRWTGYESQCTYIILECYVKSLHAVVVELEGIDS